MREGELGGEERKEKIRKGEEMRGREGGREGRTEGGKKGEAREKCET